MTKLFLSIFNMSLTASIMVALVLLARLCLRKAPKIYSYILWSVVLFRLLCPVTLTAPAGVLSLFSASSESGASEYTTSMQYISPEFTAHYEPTIPEAHTPTVPVNNNAQISYTAEIQEAEKQPTGQRSAKEIALTILGWLWLAGVVVFVGYTSLQYIQLNRRLKFAYRLRGNIFESDEIETAFVLGVFPPRIYLPCGLNFDVQKAVIAHEQTHQRRGDHVVKILAYLALALHWFNPLAWLSFKLACDDMEKSCDEAVLRNMRNRGYEEKSVKVAYGQMLYALGSGQRNLFSPVSFAETGIKGRVKNVLNYRRLTKATSVILSVSVVFALAACVVNPSSGGGSTLSLSETDDNEYMSDQEEVRLTVKNQADVDNLKKYRNLKHLSISIYSEFISSFDFELLSQLDSVESIEIYSDLISASINLSPLSNLENLHSLALNTGTEPNRAIDLSFIRDCNSLTKVELSSCCIKDLSVLSNLSNIENLSIGYCVMMSGAQLENMPSLKSVFFMGNRVLRTYDDYDSITSANGDYYDTLSLNALSAVSGNLTEIECDIHTKQDEDFISSLENLLSLNAHTGTEIINMDWLRNLKSLKTLGLFFSNSKVDLNVIASMNWLKNLTITNLSNDGNHVSLPNLSTNTGLKRLELYLYGGYTDDDLRFLQNMTSLEVLRLSGGIEKLPDLSRLDKLRSISVISSGLTDISGIRSLHSLTYVYLSPDDELLTDDTNWIKVGFLPPSQFENISCWGNMETVDIYCERLEDIAFLGEAVKLKTLKLNCHPHESFNPQKYEFLYELSALQNLDITLCEYDEAAVEFFKEFKADRLQCDVTYRFS